MNLIPFLCRCVASSYWSFSMRIITSKQHFEEKGRFDVYFGEIKKDYTFSIVPQTKTEGSIVEAASESV